MIFPETVWRIHHKPHTVYLTFDDGPIPEVTPWVLDTLDHYGIKATFFCVGENVKRSPLLFQEILLRGHSVGNHTTCNRMLKTSGCAFSISSKRTTE